MKSVNEFRLLQFGEKFSLLMQRGRYIMQRHVGGFRVFLFGVHSFFVEVFYSPKYQRVLLISAVDQLTGLEPYLDEISLKDLVASPRI